MVYQLEIKNSARKDLLGIPEPARKRVDRAILALVDNPRPRDAIKLANRDNLWRIRVGDYRIIYRVEDDQLIVLVVRIAHRREAYR
jgi:mRNA interferase RelE/StbE